MPSWKGNPSNPVPNPVQESVARSEKRTEQNRSIPVRRDTDKQKDQKITLMDVDQVIFDHLASLQISVVDEGKAVKVPIFYGSPEKWVAARRHGYIRDRQGKIQLPAMIFRRTSSENDDDVEIFNRYVRYPVVQKNSHKNKYTPFSLLTSQNAPVNEVFHITMADHMVFTYSFIVWTEYHEQMNPIIEKIKFNTKDYWGSPRGFRFRVRAEGFTHSTELNSDDDRIVRTEFNLVTNGYILPESYQLLDRQYPTTEKLFTPKKIIMGTEVVATDFDLQNLSKNGEKWRSQQYPNLKKGDEPVDPGITWGDSRKGTPLSSETVAQILTTLAGVGKQTEHDAALPLWQPVPVAQDAPGKEGWMAYDSTYLYIYSGGQWRRVPLASFA